MMVDTSNCQGCYSQQLLLSTVGGVVPGPDSDVELLETLLTKVMRLAAMHGEPPIGNRGGPALSMAESVLLVELLTAGEVTQQQVADRLGLDKSRVSRLCSSLEGKHLLVRQRDAGNRRNLRLRLTSSGAAAATRLRHTWQQRHERMLAAMTPDERHALLLGLGALVRELAAFHDQYET
jgi:DNA-binding MarR family transcriptional regulator